MLVLIDCPVCRGSARDDMLLPCSACGGTGECDMYSIEPSGRPVNKFETRCAGKHGRTLKARHRKTR